MIFSNLQVSRDHIRLLTASFRHLFSVVYCNKGHCLEIVKFNGCTVHTWETTVQPWFVSYKNVG